MVFGCTASLVRYRIEWNIVASWIGDLKLEPFDLTRTTTNQNIYKKGFIEVNGREKRNNLADDSGFNME